jgi:tetratricopeptide (TPR) repeat protein/tRNA A-37 threonylcarbamoyl transferase component Bud32
MSQIRLEKLFHAARAIADAGERAAFVARECGGDAALRAGVDALLAAEARMGARFLEPPTSGEPTSVETPGALIGRYKLLQQIGEGGFGVVWMAEQKEPVKRRVALKIIKLGMDTKQVVARFEQERQALALMDHPNIAKVFDAGATASGRPYFVMELVKGVPIVEYCDQEKLDTRARLELFVAVCRAIQHAHHKGIIHRDIKPSNVLVTLHDGRPVPKVIDFGIAKATSAELTTLTLFTEHRQMIGTPAYMSPEQAEMSGLDIDTRSDVYSLGVLLYELLTGTTPFDVRELLEKGLAEMLRIIREVEPHKPSTRVSSLGDTTSKAAEQRKLDPRRFGAVLRGDLDWIVMRCLEKDRTRRYETANGLALDVERFLAGEAISAAPPSAAYRARKWLRRNRVFATAGSLVLLALVSGLVATMWQARIAATERDAAAAARDKADRAAAAELQRAEELRRVAEFQAKMLANVSPREIGAALLDDLQSHLAATLEKTGVPESERAARLERFASELRASNTTDAAIGVLEHAILTPARSAIEVQFAAQPLVAASLRQTLGYVYHQLGRYDAALELRQQALAAYRTTLAPDAEETLRAMLDVGHTLRELARIDEAQALYAEALERSRCTRGDEDDLTLWCESNVAGILRARGKASEAEPLLRHVLEARKRVFGEDAPLTLEALASHAGVLGELGRIDEAYALTTEVVERRRRVLGAEHPDTLVSEVNVVRALMVRRRYVEAEPLAREALEKCRRVFGENHPQTLLSSNLLAQTFAARGDYAQAEPLLRDTLRQVRRIFGDEHPETFGAMAAIGDVVKYTGHADEAEELLRAAYAGFVRVKGADDRATISALNNLAQLLADRGKFADAVALHQQALETRRRVLGPEHPDTLASEVNCGAALFRLGKLDDALPLLTHAHEGLSKQLGPDDGNTSLALNNLASLLLARRDFEAAAARYREAVASLERSSGKDQFLTGHARAGLGRALAELDRFTEAETELREAWRVLTTAPGVPASSRKRCIDAFVALYTRWHVAEPGAGHDARAAEWQARTP